MLAGSFNLNPSTVLVASIYSSWLGASVQAVRYECVHGEVTRCLYCVHHQVE